MRQTLAANTMISCSGDDARKGQVERLQGGLSLLSKKANAFIQPKILIVVLHILIWSTKNLQKAITVDSTSRKESPSVHSSQAFLLFENFGVYVRLHWSLSEQCSHSINKKCHIHCSGNAEDRRSMIRYATCQFYHQPASSGRRRTPQRRPQNLTGMEWLVANSLENCQYL